MLVPALSPPECAIRSAHVSVLLRNAVLHHAARGYRRLRGGGHSRRGRHAHGILATRLGISAFLLPWFFVTNPGILWVGSAFDIAFDFVGIFVSLMLLSSAFTGVMFAEIGRPVRALFAVLGGLFVVPLPTEFNYVLVPVSICVVVAFRLRGRRRSASAAGVEESRPHGIVSSHPVRRKEESYVIVENFRKETRRHAGRLSDPVSGGRPAHAAGGEVAWPKRLIVSAPSSGTPASMIMASIARVIEKNTPIQRVIVQPIGGINNFAPMMEKGEVDIAIHSGADVLAHMAGLEENRMSFMRTLLPTSVQAFVVLTTPDKGIHNLNALRGKVVYSRNPGNTMFDPVVKALACGRWPRRIRSQGQSDQGQQYRGCGRRGGRQSGCADYAGHDQRGHGTAAGQGRMSVHHARR